MIQTGILIGFLIQLASYSLVSGLCSTCRDERCYDNGECTIGCVSGHVGEYCDEECPSRCLNKICHPDIIDGTVTCTDGCEEGYCGPKCTIRCLEDCVTCDRQCGSCNVTLCPERRYGVDCSEICSAKYGKCDRETGKCIICREGYYGDECNQECPSCFTRADTISDTCLSGCDICQSKDTCQDGFYGDKCERRCSAGCHSERVCNKATGECSDGCLSGYHGLTCNYTCSGYCLSRKCDRATGECSDGCVSGYHGMTCNNTCSRLCVGGTCIQHNGICTSGCISGYEFNLDKCEKDSNERLYTAVIITVAGVVCVAVVVLIYVFRRNRQSRWYCLNNTETQQVAGETDTFLPNQPDQGIQSREHVVYRFPDEYNQVQIIRTRTLDEINLKTAGMVRVSAVDTVLVKLNTGQRWATIIGNAGDGNTTLGYLVLKEFLEKIENVFIVYSPNEYDQISKIKGKRVVMFDDRFGAFVADEHLIKDWLNVIRRILSYKENDLHVIFVSRKNVVHESMMFLGQLTDKMFDPSCTVDLSKRKVIEERLKILEYHLERENVNVSGELKNRIANKDIAHGFPNCCQLYSTLSSKGYDVDIEKFFESPLEFLDKTTKFLYNGKCKELFQLMIKGDGQFIAYTVKDENKRQKLLEVVKEQEGSYITVLKNGICQFAHSAVYESVLNVINDIDSIYCVQYASLSVIRQKMLISTSDEEDRYRSLCYIIVKPVLAVLMALAERFREEIDMGHYSVFKHRLCQCREFCEALVACCVNTSENESLNRFINKPGKDGDTMLWTAIKSGRLIAAEVLVKANADVNIQDDRGRTPLHFLFQLNSPTAAVDYDDDCKDSNNMNITKLIITEGRGDVNICDQYGQTPLHYLCQHNLYPAIEDENQVRLGMDTLRHIIDHGRGDINIPDQYGYTPLHYLFKCNTVSQDEIQWIITEARGDLNKCEQNESTPLHYLCANSDLQLGTADLVITKGKGDFNKGDEHGTTPLHFLCENRTVEFDVIYRIVNSEKGDINKQDGNGVTPLHVLCKGSLPVRKMLTLISKGDNADRYGNTPLHYLCRRRGINVVVVQRIKEILNQETEKPNVLGYTPFDYLNDKDDVLQWEEGMIHRSATDLVLCRLKHGDKWIVVLGPAMFLDSDSEQEDVKIESFGRELTNVFGSGEKRPVRFSLFYGSCCSPNDLFVSSSPLPNPLYLEMTFRIMKREDGSIQFLMGVVEGHDNLDRDLYVAKPRPFVCVFVSSLCNTHPNNLCSRLLRTDQEGNEDQSDDCVILSHNKAGEVLTFTFGLVIDIGRSRVSFIDVGKGELLYKVDQNFKNSVSPMFHVNAHLCDARMRLISGREISVNDRKIELIQQALSD